MVNHIHIYAEDKTHILYSRICFICPRNNTFGFSLVFYLDIFVLHRGIMGKIYLDRTNILIKQCNNFHCYRTNKLKVLKDVLLYNLSINTM